MSTIRQLRQANPERIKAVRNFFFDQAMVRSGHACGITLAITIDNKIQTGTSCVEPEHAVSLLAPLRSLLAQLETMAMEEVPELMCFAGLDEELPENVVRLRSPILNRQSGGKVLRLTPGTTSKK